LIPWDAFVTFANAVIDAYNAKAHRGLPMTTDERGRRVHFSPDSYWQTALDAGWKPVAYDKDYLDELLPCEERQVARGEINLHANRYYSGELAEYHGDRVRVAFDPWDPTRVWVRDMEGRFLAEAKLDGNLTDYFGQSFIGQSAAKRDEMAERRAMLKVANKRSIDMTGLGTLEMRDRLAHAMEEPPKEEPLGMSEDEAAAIEASLARQDQKLEDDIDRFIRLVQMPLLTAADSAFVEYYKTTVSGRAIVKTLNLPAFRPEGQEGFA